MSSPVPHGFVFYPRTYTVDEANPDASYVDGVDHAGVERRVFLNPDERAREAARKGTAETVPSLNRFAESGRRAKNPCFADPKNGPDSPVGVLLIEQATARADGAVEARWASVLSESDETPAPAVGIGGLEMYYHPKPDAEVAGWLAHYRQLMATPGVDAIVQRAELFNQILEARRIWTIASVLKPEETVTLENGRGVTREDIKAAANPFLEKYTRDGLYGGVWIRVRQGDVVFQQVSQMVNRQFDYKQQQVQTLEQVWEAFDRFQAPKLGRFLSGQQGLIVDVVPMERINAGKAGNDKFKKDWMALRDGGVPKLQKLYCDKGHYLNPLEDPIKANAQLVASVAVRKAGIYTGPTKGNQLMSTIHAFSAPLGHPLQIDPTGQASYKIHERLEQARERAAQEPSAGYGR